MPLDGTLGICVATKNNKNTSFMNNNSYDKFVEITKKIDVLPVTTRCKKSYLNIYLKKYFQRALVDNGATLVSENKNEEEEWLEESRNIVLEHNAKQNFDKAREIIELYGYKEKWGSEFVLDYVYKSNIPIENIKEKIEEELKPLSDTILINVGNTSILCTYKCLSKGNNIKRYANHFNFNIYLTSGDNKEDESMFENSQISIGKEKATYVYEDNSKSKLKFCDWVIQTVYDLI
jgi:hydroxymethylpyrimidine pyrophosphatase-like HAD family hydrolase